MKECAACPSWNNGRGKRECLKCSHYKRFQVKNSQRSQIPIDVLPDSILESFAEYHENMPDIIDAIQHLPDDLSAIIAMRFISNLSTRSVAVILKTSQATISRKTTDGLNHIRNILMNDSAPLEGKTPES